MNERGFRFIQGLYILIALYLESAIMMYIYLGVIGFEALTNWRVPILVSRLRYGRAMVDEAPQSQIYKFKFEAERMLRVVVLGLMVLTFIVFPDIAWFFPWFIGVMLFMAGITNICPMVMFMRFLGFR
jgi:hypothetical protein